MTSGEGALGAMTLLADDIESPQKLEEGQRLLATLAAQTAAAIERARLVHRVGYKRRLEAIPGMVPNPLDWPSGCRFRDRCARADRRCRETEPPLVELAPGHRVACLKVA